VCGICGMIAVDGALDPAVRAALPAMTDAIHHRGPDAEGHFTDDVAALGHRRLSIIDLATGDQPIPNEDRTRWIVFNGEIYNHRDVRRDLAARGHVFRTSSDTEAILHGFEEYGTAIVDRLEGMFAIAIYDATRRELFLARDRLGKKPLFYAVLDGVLHFASEMKCFYRSPRWDATLDLGALEGYFSLGYFLAPNTVYKHVRKLEPGHWLHLANGRVETRQYWDVTEFDTDRRPIPAVLEDLEPLLAGAVRERLESEVPLGAFLSGGIDSGLVVSFMKEAATSAVITASVGFERDTASELDAAGVTARHLGTHHYPHLVEARLDDLLEPVVAAFDEPFADASAIPTWYVSKAAREHVTVALSGDGGDETFAGYDFRYVPHAIEHRVRRLGGPLGRGLAAGLATLWPRGPRVPRPLRLGSFLDNLATDPAGSYYLDLCFLKPAATRTLLGVGSGNDPRDSAVYEAVTAPYRRCPSTSAVQKAQYADLKVYMPNDPLVKVDRMAMQHALEVRCPMLDRRVVEFAFRLPTETKMAGLRGKHLLRTLAARRLPPEISRLPKLGFTAPVAQWMAGPYRDMVSEDLFASTSRIASVVDIRRLKQLHSEHVSGQRDHWYALWASWVFERWARTGAQPPAPARA
jgi:asparagine synthase (glutamine-hydrolysing)